MSDLFDFNNVRVADNQSQPLSHRLRPQRLKDLIGQDVMIKTITNAIKLGKTPNAYLLTGIRGVGKTTTARLIAKALNCSKDFSKGEKCKTGEYCHCSEIINSNFSCRPIIYLSSVTFLFFMIRF